MHDSLLVRSCLVEDIAQVCQLDLTSNPHPWSQSLLQQSLTKDISFVAECDSKIVGFIIFLDAVDTLELLLIVSHVASRRKGVARQLIAKGLSELESQPRYEKCFLEVRVSNLPAIKLYESLGFVQCGKRKNYYNSGPFKEDALLFHYEK